jgi:hypothetical protein
VCERDLRVRQTREPTAAASVIHRCPPDDFDDRKRGEKGVRCGERVPSAFHLLHLDQNGPVSPKAASTPTCVAWTAGVARVLSYRDRESAAFDRGEPQTGFARRLPGPRAGHQDRRQGQQTTPNPYLSSGTG